MKDQDPASQCPRNPDEWLIECCSRDVKLYFVLSLLALAELLTWAVASKAQSGLHTCPGMVQLMLKMVSVTPLP